MKKILPLTLCLILVACSAIPSELLSALYTPTAPPPTKVVTATITPTITATQPTPTFTFTPTLIGAKPSPTETATPTIDSSATATRFGPTETPGPTMTATAVQKYGGVASVFISVNKIYYGECEPTETVISASVLDTKNVVSMVAFFRLVDKKTLKAGDWNPSFSMKDTGGGTFTLTLKSIDILDYRKYTDVWVSYQLVGADKNGDPIARTQITTNSISLMACP